MLGLVGFPNQTGHPQQSLQWESRRFHHHLSNGFFWSSVWDKNVRLHGIVDMDVSAAHKRMILHPSQKGYSAFSLNGIAYQYKTCQAGSVTWLGLEINLVEMTISVTQQKFNKIFSLLPDTILQKMKRKDLESITGILMWISQVIPHLKSSLATLYHDCAQGSVSAKFVQLKLLQDITAACTKNLDLLSSVGSIKAGCKILKISRQQALASRQFQGGWIVLYDIRPARQACTCCTQSVEIPSGHLSAHLFPCHYKW